MSDQFNSMMEGLTEALEYTKGDKSKGRLVVRELNDALQAIKARKEFGEAFRAAQQEAVKNGTSEMMLDEINEIIAESRRERREEELAGKS